MAAKLEARTALTCPTCGDRLYVAERESGDTCELVSIMTCESDAHRARVTVELDTDGIVIITMEGV